jgi:hypothetical protein
MFPRVANPLPDSRSATGLPLPGDCNQDSGVDIPDAVCVLGSLFLGTPE